MKKKVKLDNLSLQLNSQHLRFASEENLMCLLGVTRGSVTMMGLANDTEHQVQLWVDDEIWRDKNFLSHPQWSTQ